MSAELPLGEVIVESIRQGTYVKCTAVHVATGREAVAITVSLVVCLAICVAIEPTPASEALAPYAGRLANLA